MHRIAGLFVALLVVITLISASSAQTTNSANINSYGTITALLPLHVDGQWIVDSNGNRIQLRGAGGDYTAYGSYANVQTYISWLKQTGCNCIRLAFTVPNNGSWQSPSDTAYNSTKMDYVLNLCNQNGIYAILDCHEYYATQAGQGWTSVLPTYEDAWINMWVSIANRYKNNPTIAIYELANEFTSGNATLIRRYFYDCINAIRATGDNHIVMCYGGANTLIWNSSSEIVPNMVISLHNLAGPGNNVPATTGYRQGVSGFFPDLMSNTTSQMIGMELEAYQGIATILSDRAILDCPIVWGESTTNNLTMSAPDVYYLQQMIILAEDYAIPWITWEFDQWEQYAPTFWTTFCNQKLGGAFTSNYVPNSIPVTQTFNITTFSGLPFNIWEYMNASQSLINYQYNWFTVNSIFIASSAFQISFHGPCMLRVQCWGNEAYSTPYQGNVTNDYILALNSSQTWNATKQANTVVYAWANSPTYLPLPNS